MIREVLLPQLAMGMSDGTIVEWKYAEGALVEKEAPLLTIETEKVVSELPSPYRGYLNIRIKAGETVPVESTIGMLADTEQEYRALVAVPVDAITSSATVTSVPAQSTSLEEASAAVSEGPRRRIPVSGLARKIAEQSGLALSAIQGSGPKGRIVRRDVLEAVEQRRQKLTAQPIAIAPPAGRVRARVPLAGMRKVIAERMVQAKTTSAAMYLFFEIDVTRLLASMEVLRAREKEFETRLSLTAVYAKALAAAVGRVPIANSILVNEEIVIREDINVGIAVALPGKGEYDSGLVVPVVRDVASKGLLAIDLEIKGLVAKARAGKLSAEDMADGTVTLSSTAGFFPDGWMVGTPLLNLPQVVNFQPGSIVEKPVVQSGQIVARHMLPCGLTVDHRAMDGEPAGRLARTIADMLSTPELMLM